MEELRPALSMSGSPVPGTCLRWIVCVGKANSIFSASNRSLTFKFNSWSAAKCAFPSVPFQTCTTKMFSAESLNLLKLMTRSAGLRMRPENLFENRRGAFHFFR